MTDAERYAIALEKRALQRELQSHGMSKREAMEEVSRRYKCSPVKRRRKKMVWTLWVVGIIALILAIASRLAFVAADRPGDDFGAGAVFWLLAFLTALFAFAWLILAAIHWSPPL